MRFIRKSTFELLPQAVQDVFLKWWKPSDGDLFWWNQDRYIDCCDDGRFMNNTDINNLKEDGDITPLFTEGQLRKFIEDKTDGVIEFEFNDVEIDLSIYARSCSPSYTYKRLGADLLQAYWKVAVILAESEVK